MDLFGKKRIRELEVINREWRLQSEQWLKEGAALRNQVEYLVRTIRDMDQEIWNMSQRTDWPAQRPHFVKLLEGTTARKHAESERINDLLRGELIETYRPDAPTQKLLGK